MSIYIPNPNAKSVRDLLTKEQYEGLSKLFNEYPQTGSPSVSNSIPPYHTELKYNLLQRLVARIFRLNTKI